MAKLESFKSKVHLFMMHAGPLIALNILVNSTKTEQKTFPLSLSLILFQNSHANCQEYLIASICSFPYRWELYQIAQATSVMFNHQLILCSLNLLNPNGFGQNQNLIRCIYRKKALKSTVCCTITGTSSTTTGWTALNVLTFSMS